MTVISGVAVGLCALLFTCIIQCHAQYDAIALMMIQYDAIALLVSILKVRHIFAHAF